CVFLVVLVALPLLAPAAVLILLPVACMLVSVCLCAIAARLLVPFVPVEPPGRAREHRGGGVRGREQNCIVVDREEAPGGGDGDASSADEEHGQQGHGQFFSTVGEDFSGSCDGEHRRVFFVDTGSYCRTVSVYRTNFLHQYSYDLLVFWGSMERQAPGGERNARYL
ncbi:hypothetical protein BS78_02G214500, partial [Paspalum vaginatum]